MSIAQQFDVAPVASVDISLVPSIEERDLAQKAALRNWIINGWQTEMPPEGTLARTLMDGVGLPNFRQSEAPTLLNSQPAGFANVDTQTAPLRLAVVSPARRTSTSRAVLTLGGGPKDPTEPGDRHLADTVMHIFPDPRRAKVLGLVALNPGGVSSTEVRDQLDNVEPNLPIGDWHRDALELWLAGNGLVVSDDSKRSRAGRHWQITDEGQKILPAAGHIVDFSASPGNPSPRIAFGQPQSYRLETQDGKPSLGRYRIEQLRHIIEHPSELMGIQDLIDRTNAGDTMTRTFVKDLIESQWLVVIPSTDRPADEYPLLAPGKLALPSYVKAGFNERFVSYISKWWDTRGEPVNLHELIHHRTLLRREVEGGPTEFKLAVFQYAAQLVSQHYLACERQASFPRTYLALNPAKIAPIRKILGIVDGAERQSTEYQNLGLQKLFVALQSRKG